MKRSYLKKILLFLLVVCSGCSYPIKIFNYEKVNSPNLCLQLSRSVKQQENINFISGSKDLPVDFFGTYYLPSFIDQSCDILDRQAVIKDTNIEVSFAVDKNDASKEFVFFHFEVNVEFPIIGGGAENKLVKTKSHLWVYPDKLKGIKLSGEIQKLSSEALNIGFKNIINQIYEELEIPVGEAL